jgi:hypothetical protein
MFIPSYKLALYVKKIKHTRQAINEVVGKRFYFANLLFPIFSAP